MNSDDKSNYISRQPIAIVNDKIFYFLLLLISAPYLLLLAGIILSNFKYVDNESIQRFFTDKNIQYSLQLSLFSCTISTILCLVVAIPIGYLLSRHQFKGKFILDTLLDIPILLPPLVIGISLLIFFTSPFIQYFERMWNISINPAFTITSVIIAQFMVACAFAIRTMRVTFDEIGIRQEQVALTLGCSKFQAFYRIVLPRSTRGIIAAASLAWARSLGEFGPILIFAGTTRLKTEVLSTSVYLEFSVGNLAMATTISVFMIIIAVAILFLIRFYGSLPSNKDDNK